MAKPNYIETCEDILNTNHEDQYIDIRYVGKVRGQDAYIFCIVNSNGAEVSLPPNQKKKAIIMDQEYFNTRFVVKYFIIEIPNCKSCPYFKAANCCSSDGFDRMEDWICGKTGKKIQSAVEWHEESKIPVPDWCPIKMV